MKQRTPASLIRGLGLVLLLVAATPFAVLARQGTPVPSSQGITLAVSGLENPRGFTWGLDGTHYIALAGSGPGQMPAEMPADAHGMGGGVGGLTGSVVYAGDEGCPVTFQDDLPSNMAPGGSARGPASVALLNNRVYTIVAGGGEGNGNPTTPNGLYALDGDGGAELVVDLGAWVRANPVATPPGDLDPEGDPFAMVAGDDELWVVEANSGQLLRITPAGEITRVADFSGTHDVPTGLALAPGGGFYVGFLTGVPYTDGAARIVMVTPDGTFSDAWTGLTAVTGVAVGPDGALYALEMGTGNTAEPPFAQSGTGKVVRQTGPAESVDIATGLDRPVAMGFGPDGGLYVGLPAFGATGPTGAIVRLNLDQGQTMTMDPALLETSTCPGAIPTPVPSDTGTPVPSDTPSDGGDPVGGDPTVSIVNFAFAPASLQVAAGTTVTWTNNDSAAHTVTADDGSFDSGNLAPGATFTYTFATAGTVSYHCTYHPNMVASVVVQ